jgi:hypothetical protein
VSGDTDGAPGSAEDRDMLHRAAAVLVIGAITAVILLLAGLPSAPVEPRGPTPVVRPEVVTGSG